MLEIIIYILCFYLVVKGVEILQIALSSNREDRFVVILIGASTLVVCIFAALIFVISGHEQASSIGNMSNSF